MPGWSIRARAPRGTPRTADVLDNIQRDADVLAAFLEDAAHFPGGHAGGLIAATNESDVAQALRGPHAGAADRRAVVAHRRRDADGRSGAHDEPPQPHPRHRDRHGARRGRRHAHRSRPGAAPGRPLLSARPDVHGRVRRRHDRHQRRRRRDVQVRDDARLGAARSRSCCRTATCSTSNAARSPRTPTATSRSNPAGARSACRCPAIGCRRSRSSRPATLPRRGWISSICSSARKARSAS